VQRNKAFLEGIGVTIFGVFFLVLSFALYEVRYVKGDRLIISYGLSVLLIVIGAVMLFLYRRTTRLQSAKKS
jgi:hypothetical protein